MKVFFDHSAPDPLIDYLVPPHTVTVSRNMEWHELRNGQLLRKVEDADFDVFLTADKNIPFQNTGQLKRMRIAIVYLGQGNWPIILPHVERVVAAVNAAVPGSRTEVPIPMPSKPPWPGHG